MASNQGISMLLNISYNVIVNAALGIAYQVNTAASTLVSNFQTAFMPQITKAYASDETTYLNKLIYTTSRYSFLLCFVVSYPIFINCDAILDFWLSSYPEFTSGLVKVIIICVGLDALSGPLWMAVHAKGDIRNYQITVSILLLLTIVACFIAVKMGYSPIIAFGSRIIVLILLFIYRVLYTRRAIGLDVVQYIKEVILRCGFITFVSLPIAFAMSYVTIHEVGKVFIDLVVAIALILYCGLNSSERTHLASWCMNRIKH